MPFIGFGRDKHNKELEEYWEDLVPLSGVSKYFHEVRITKSKDNALQVAAIHGQEDCLARMIAGIKGKVSRDDELLKALSNKNKRGHTLLHRVASRGSLSVCKCILGEEDFYPLVHIRNNEGETPLFLAAVHGHKETFLYLHCVSKRAPTPSTNPWRKNGGDTILHVALWREYFDLSFQIIHLYKDQHIVSAVNERGITPLHVLARKPSSFRSGIHFPWCSKLLYYSTMLKLADLPITIDAPPTESKSETNSVTLNVSPTELQSLETNTEESEEINRSEDNKGNLPQNYDTSHNICGLVRDVVQRRLMREWRKIIEKRKDHKWCLQVMHVLVEEYFSYEYVDDGYDPAIESPQDADERKEIMMINYESKIVSSSNDVKNGNGDQQNLQGKKASKNDDDKQRHEETMTQFLTAAKNDVIEMVREILKTAPMSKNDDDKERYEETMTPFLTAAKNGVIEMVREILKRAPMTIHETTTENKNILLLAAENRQPHIIEELKYHDAWDSLIQTVDNEGNNLLHLAAQVSESKPWNIPGEAMQMQWEIKWYQYVKAIIPKHLIFRGNNKEEIPIEIFTNSHKDLVASGGEWLKKTSESCSVVAALIAGVSFATSSSVPGGTNDQTGKPRLEGELAFNLFAITSLASLCFSVTALITFLAILTSRQQPKDFRRDLPFKLLFGLSFLFVSIVSMLVSFCAAYFFVLNDRLHNNVVFIIYAATCLPVTFYAVAQFPLYWDLLRAILTDVPRQTHKGG